MFGMDVVFFITIPPSLVRCQMKCCTDAKKASRQGSLSSCAKVVSVTLVHLKTVVSAFVTCIDPIVIVT